MTLGFYGIGPLQQIYLMRNFSVEVHGEHQQLPRQFLIVSLNIAIVPRSWSIFPGTKVCLHL